MQKSRFLSAILMAVLMVCGVLYGIGPLHAKPAMPAPMAAVKPAKAAPAVVFTDAAGTHPLASYKGHYVLLNMWATYCAPCIAELPALAKLKAAVPSLTVLAVNTDRPSVDAVGFLKSHNVTQLGSLRGDTGLMGSFKVYALPTTVLIDPKGNVVGRAEGPAEWASPDAIAYFKSLAGS
jgi:thiol-disulfide isomerase/thioredoxin